MTHIEHATSHPATVVMESMTVYRDTFQKVKESDPLDIHELIIAIAQSNLDKLRDTLLERSTPGTELYQQWLSYDEIGDYVRNEIANESIENWFKNESIEITYKSPHGEYLRAKATIETWERVLSTKFYMWHDTAITDQTIRNDYHHRSYSYSVPVEYSNHISAIFNTCQVPPVLVHHYESSSIPLNSNASIAAAASGLTCSPGSPCQVDVNFLTSLYGISSTQQQGSNLLSQAVFETQGESFSQNDLAKFQSIYKLRQQAALVEGTVLNPSETCSKSNHCEEGSLDLQYIMGIAQDVNTIFWYTYDKGDNFLNFLLDVSATPSPPTALSISWGANEFSYSNSYLDAFNTEAMKVSAMGITILVASGDTGVYYLLQYHYLHVFT